MFILHADHEQNCSANAMRSVGSSQVDPFSAVAAATAALYGPLHGGANEQAIRMLTEIGSVQNVPAYIKRVKAGEIRLQGFGHRVYKNYDPRAKIIKRIADEVFEVTGKNPLIDIALELERIALADDYFISHRLYPNVDFYSGIIYQAMGFPLDMFPVLFAIGRTPGWMAQWQEMLLDPETRIARPRQIYIGAGPRDYVPLARSAVSDDTLQPAACSRTRPRGGAAPIAGHFAPALTVSSEAEAALAGAETAAAALVLERASATRAGITEAAPPRRRTRIC